jgi:hypothetical protein
VETWVSVEVDKLMGDLRGWDVTMSGVGLDGEDGHGVLFDGRLSSLVEKVFS